MAVEDLKVRETYSDQLGDLINLDFAAAAVKPQAAARRGARET